MEWVFIALVVAVVAAAAMVVVGRGDGLAPALPDRPDVELPTGRPLTAADLTELRLSVAVRGYRMDEVDALLARLGAELAAGEVPQPPGAVSAAPDRGAPAPASPAPAPLAPAALEPAAPAPATSASAASTPAAPAPGPAPTPGPSTPGDTVSAVTPGAHALSASTGPEDRP